jgi:hypothetical protein
MIAIREQANLHIAIISHINGDIMILMVNKKPLKKQNRRQKITESSKKALKRKGLNRWLLVAIAVPTAILLLVGLSNLSDFLWPKVKNPNYGASFSIKYAKELGNDWQANYTALLDDMGFKNLRLMSYWDESEAVKGQYNFSDLDWQMDEAAKRGAKVSLGLGFRQPRWPECHQPAWAKEIGYGTDEWQAALNNYITVVQNRYKNHPALGSYQLENEAKNAWFGECPGAASTDRLIEEFNLAKNNDPNHPVYMSLSDQHGFPAGQPVPDKYGFSVYRIVWNDKTPIHFYLTYPTPVWYHKARATAIKIIKDRDFFVHELQVEPWGPKATKDLSLEEQNRSMSPKQINKNFTFVKKIGTEDIYTWGGEWWYWRKTQFNDPSIWDTVKKEVSGNSRALN